MVFQQLLGPFIVYISKFPINFNVVGKLAHEVNLEFNNIHHLNNTNTAIFDNISSIPINNNNDSILNGNTNKLELLIEDG